MDTRLSIVKTGSSLGFQNFVRRFSNVFNKTEDIWDFFYEN